MSYKGRNSGIKFEGIPTFRFGGVLATVEEHELVTHPRRYLLLHIPKTIT
jgi:hypothetical protein